MTFLFRRKSAVWLFRNGKMSRLALKQKVMWNKCMKLSDSEMVKWADLHRNKKSCGINTLYIHVLHHFGNLCRDWHSKTTPQSHPTKQDHSYPKTPHACHRQTTLHNIDLSLDVGQFYTVMLFSVCCLECGRCAPALSSNTNSKTLILRVMPALTQ